MKQLLVMIIFIASVQAEAKKNVRLLISHKLQKRVSHLAPDQRKAFVTALFKYCGNKSFTRSRSGLRGSTLRLFISAKRGSKAFTCLRATNNRNGGRAIQ